MKHFKFILPFIFILFSCTTESIQTSENTQLEIIVKDENNNPLGNVNVKLYTSENDMNNGTNSIQTLNTNSNGKVTFSNLQPIKYYWRTSSDCYGINSIDNSATPLTTNVLNQFTINLPDNFIGDISIENTTAYEQSVIISGPNTYTFNIPAGSPPVNLTGCPIGTYTCSNTPIGSPLTIPNSLTFDLHCNDTNWIVFQ